MNRSRIAAVSAAMLLTAGLAGQSPEMRHEGVVRSGGLAVPGALVTATQGARKIVTVTDEHGRYLLEGLTPGAWELEVQLPGFLPARRTVELPAAARLEWSLEIEPPTLKPRSARRAQGFERLALNRASETVEGRLEEELQTHALPSGFRAETSANEAFLLSGSLSANLQEGLRQGLLEQMRMAFEHMRELPAGAEALARTFGGARPEDAGLGAGGLPPYGPKPEAPPGMAAGAGPGPGSGMGSLAPPGPSMGGPGMMGGPGLAGPASRGGPNVGPGGRGGFGRPGARAGGGVGPGRGMWLGDGPFGNRIARGRETVRGGLFFSLNNSAFDARPYSLTGQKVEKPSYAQSRFGLNLGGPLALPKLPRSDRTFFFLNYSGTRARSPFDATSTLPTLEQRAGDFSQPLGSLTTVLFDPLGRLPFPGSRIPLPRMDPIARGLLEFFPLPNQPGTLQNYQYVTSNGSDSDQLAVRVMRPLSARDRLDFNLSAQWRKGTASQLYGFRDATSGRGLNLTGGWTHNVSRTTIWTLRANLSRNRNETLPYFAYKRDVAGELGILGVSRDPINYGPPNLNFTNFGDLTDASAAVRRNQQASLSPSLLLVRGRHNVSVGGEFRRVQINARTDQNARGSFTFTGLATSAVDQAGQPQPGTGLDFADFLLGLPQSSSVRFGAANNYFRASHFSAFLMEDWRLGSNFSLNLGLRYEYFQPFYEKFDRMANLDVAADFAGVAVVTPTQTGPYSGRFPRGLVDSDRNNLAPRVGLAWRPSSRRSLLWRASYGIFYNGAIYGQFPQRLASQPPFANTATLNTSSVRVLTLRDGFAVSPSKDVTNTYAVDRSYRTGYAQTWSLSLQHSLTRTLVVELGYLGTKGTRLDVQRMPNRAAPGSPLTAEDRRRIGNAVGFVWDSSEGNSIYHGGQVRLMRRLARGVSANLLYVYSKSIDNASTLGGGAAVVAQNDRDLRAERGRSSFDQRHSLNLFYVVQSPVREGSRVFPTSRWAGRLLGNWSLSGGLSAGSGTPFTARVLGNLADAGGTGTVGAGRADATGLPIRSDTGFFNLAAFTVPKPGAFGNAGRNTIDGPTVWSLNLSLARTIPLGERRTLELRMDGENVTNHVSFTNLGTVVNAADYGLPKATAPMRRVTAQLRLRF
ncbi:MAG: TonB-dependent receptor [Bryobacterales bacterium]|nr:TonB-dependent receptor [Bryobacteraceae bacterium]MDW8131494.1 TonB-dependent receptor [Bryobacterales bacterium]